MNAQKNQKNNNMLPLDVIEAATKGDVEAINKVLAHYESYIIALSTKQLFDEDGNSHFVVDNEIRRALETKLITKILQFDITRIE